MSGIDTSTPSASNIALPREDADAGPIDLDALPLPTGDIGQFISRHIPVMRRPPALRFAEPIEPNNNMFNALISQHVKRLEQQDPDTVAYSLAEFVVRRKPEIEASKLSPSASHGFENLVETVRMFEHIYVARSGSGGQS
ncbi:MAG: hypothetical protein ABJ251_03925 [Paracoccaceae bacterium]